MTALEPGGDRKFHSCLPSGRSIFRSHPGTPAREYFTYLPHNANAASPVVVLVHGIARNAAEHILRFQTQADRVGAILVAPLFIKEAYGQYQQVIDQRTGARADEALFDILDAVAAATGASVERFYLFGFSGGAQFAHRFMMLHPERTAAIAIAAAGWYTFPNAELPYPYGIGSCPIPSRPFDPGRFVSVPRHVLVGEQDLSRDESFRTSRKLDRVQGTTRRARAQSWFEAMNQATRSICGEAGRSKMTLLTGIGHSFTEAAQQEDLTKIVFRDFGLLSPDEDHDE